MKEKAEAKKHPHSNATLKDFEVIVSPLITEKSMANLESKNQITLEISPKANKSEVKAAFERLYNVEATHVNIINVREKSTTRGGRYQGKIEGYKKAIVTIKKGQSVDLFKE